MIFLPVPIRSVRLLLVVLGGTLFPYMLPAQDVVTPDAGSILQQIQPVTPPSPTSGTTGLTIKQQGGTDLPPGQAFEVRTIRITGQQLFDATTLHALIADGEGKILTLTQLDELTARISDFYRQHGYPLARAIIPAQTITGGVVNFEIIEARYDTISLDNSSRVKNSLLQATLSPLQSGQTIYQAPLDHALLLLSDIPGVIVAATLMPGDLVGTSKLQVNTNTGPMLSGLIATDNYGNRYTGRERLSGTLNLINPLHHGDVLSVNGLTSGKALYYWRIAYESLLNGRGTRLGGAYSALDYTLGDTLKPLDANGTAQVESLWAKHPLVRRRDLNVYGHIQYDRMQLRDHIDVAAIQNDRTLANGTVSVIGDARDTFLSSGAVSAWNMSWTTGRVAFDDMLARQTDAATADTQGRFSRWNATIARLQTLTSLDGLYLAFSGQWANENLDTSQKMTAGGPYTVRAYDMGVLSGDSGYLGTIELRHELGLDWFGVWQLLGFIDSQHVTINHTPWFSADNSARLSGAGVGLNWTGPHDLSARTYIARPIGPTPSQVESKRSARAWLEVSMRF